MIVGLAQRFEIMKTVLLIIGILALLVGLVWIGQGTGYFRYPPSSFMIDQTAWAYRGSALALAGLIGIVIARRL